MSAGADAHELLAAIRRIHERVRDAVVAESERARVEELAAVADDEHEGDTIYVIDRVSEEVVVEMFESEVAARTPLVLTRGLPDVRDFVEMLGALFEHPDAEPRTLFDPRAELFVARRRVVRARQAKAGLSKKGE